MSRADLVCHAVAFLIVIQSVERRSRGEWSMEVYLRLNGGWEQ
jgi:hypothetical protein